MLRGVRVGESLMLRGRVMVVGGQLTLHFPPRSIRQQPIAKIHPVNWMNFSFC